MAEGIAARLTKLIQMGLYIPSGIYKNGLQMATRLEWDENKNRANRAKHAIAFETAALVFEVQTLSRVKIARSRANNAGKRSVMQKAY